MVVLGAILSILFVSLLTYFILKKRNLLNRRTKFILLVVLAFVLFLILSLIYDTDTKNLGGGYTYYYEHSDTKQIFHKFPAEGGEIPANVISYDYNRDFIIAKQKPKKMTLPSKRNFSILLVVIRSIIG